MGKSGKKIETRGSGRGRGINSKEAKIAAKIVVNGGTLGDAMKALNYSESSATHRTEALTKNPLYKKACSEIKEALLRRDERFADKVARTIDEGLAANVTKFFAHEGRVIEERDCVDHPTRHKFAETCCKLFGGFTGKDDSDASGISIGQLTLLVRSSRTERGLDL